MSPVRRMRAHLPLLAWLVLVWMLLWGTRSWANLLSGLLVATLLMTVLPLPPVEGGNRLRPIALLGFLGRFALDLVTSAGQVAWQALRPGPPRCGAIVRVPLRTDSELLLTMVAEAVSLVPGSLVVDLDREQSVLSVHLLYVRDLDDVAQQKAHVLDVEERLARAFGSAADLAALDRDAERSRP
ncbi:Na+/H+ antiporter subunit E [Modestobacter marinus]|uniref:Na+/H+ antiporter subunit E n=1 Tax=Modestobacter marinus TaxID=477641 RepID=UPI0027E1B994|nr:Na+/H+ antiporter subunit E [Modestobacter marinus]